ncbi:MAG: hypothetical protein ACKOAD_02165 [Gammaproteobacteria bacterium]
MLIHTPLKGADIYLQCLSSDDVNEDYVSWMNDKEINKYMETRYKSWSMEEIKDYVNIQNVSVDQLLLGALLHKLNYTIKAV